MIKRPTTMWKKSTTVGNTRTTNSIQKYFEIIISCPKIIVSLPMIDKPDFFLVSNR